MFHVRKVRLKKEAGESDWICGGDIDDTGTELDFSGDSGEGNEDKTMLGFCTNGDVEELLGFDWTTGDKIAPTDSVGLSVLLSLTGSLMV